jgi:hypothetical protein
MLTPMLALIVLTLLVWIWMYATRIPAMRKAGITPQDARHPGSLDGLPSSARQVTDNYNHLLEQPTIFYALVFYCIFRALGRAAHLSGLGLCRSANGSQLDPVHGQPRRGQVLRLLAFDHRSDGHGGPRIVRAPLGGTHGICGDFVY